MERPTNTGHPVTTYPDNLDDLLFDVQCNRFQEGAMTRLPTYGGETPANTNGVWSWDATRLMVGTCARDMRLVLRSEVST